MEGLIFKAEVKREWVKDCIREVKTFKLVNKCACEKCLEKYESIGESLSEIYLDAIEDGKKYLLNSIDAHGVYYLWFEEVE